MNLIYRHIYTVCTLWIRDIKAPTTYYKLNVKGSNGFSGGWFVLRNDLVGVIFTSAFHYGWQKILTGILTMVLINALLWVLNRLEISLGINIADTTYHIRDDVNSSNIMNRNCLYPHSNTKSLWPILISMAILRFRNLDIKRVQLKQIKGCCQYC